jgi:hypothetical protein
LYLKNKDFGMSHECSECTFVASKEDIYLGPEVLRNLTFKPVGIGKFTLPGWSGHSNFYVFVCPGCNQAAVDYPHGAGQFYLVCWDCSQPTGSLGHRPVTRVWLKERSYYEAEKRPFYKDESRELVAPEGYKLISTEGITMLIKKDTQLANRLEKIEKIAKTKRKMSAYIVITGIILLALILLIKGLNLHLL